MRLAAAIAGLILAGCGGDPLDPSPSEAGPETPAASESAARLPATPTPPAATPRVVVEGEEAIAQLMLGDARSMLKSEKSANRIQGAMLLASMGESAAPARAELVAAASDPDMTVRIAALDALARVKAPATMVDELVRRLTGTVWVEAEAAVRALESAENRQTAEPALLAALEALPDVGKWEQRALYVMGLGACRASSEPAKLAVLDSIEHPSPTVRAGGLRALPAVVGTSPGTLRILIAGLADSDAFARRAAADSLNFCGPGATEALRTVLFTSTGEVRVNAASAILRSEPADGAATDAVLAGVADGDWRVRTAAVQALGKVPAAASRSVPLLIAAIGDPEPLVGADAARALGQLGLAAADAVPALTEAVAGGDSLMRLAAARALALIRAAQRAELPGAAASPRQP